jgi:hypothetical protein
MRSALARRGRCPRRGAAGHVAWRRGRAGTLVTVDVPQQASYNGTGRGEAALAAALLGLVAGAIAVGWRERKVSSADPARVSGLRAW